MTNSNLIPVFNGLIASQPVQLCNARELHQFVESKRDYSTWIKDRITDYGFVQNEDYIIVTQRTNGRPRKEYHITLDMGKELAMVERNEKGRQVRKYFIECERKALQQPKQLALPEPPKMYQRELTEVEMQNLCWMWYALRNYIELTDKLAKLLGGFGGDYARAIHQMNERYRNLPQTIQPTLERITAEFNADNLRGNGWNRIIYNVRHPNFIIRIGKLVHLF
ncbi:antA/AntB antirepressor family protein [Avibacterium avium]|uniref:antA/AntB antirepressor family protein n=1 Tax=Avibacterium avium TaxID=751 RepID=UPI0039FBD95B